MILETLRRLSTLIYRVNIFAYIIG